MPTTASSTQRFAPLALPPAIETALEDGATLSISISGGKDSQALANALQAAHATHGWPGEVHLLHADLGRAEWPQTPGFIETLRTASGLPLHVVQRAKGDLVARIEERAAQLDGTRLSASGATLPVQHEITFTLPASDTIVSTASGAKPHWPSAAARYCTSDLKRGPIDQFLRRYPHVISAEGVRAAESRARAKKPSFEVRSQITTRDRRAWTWRPLLQWSDEDVWAACGTSSAELTARQAQAARGDVEGALAGWPCHPAYVLGNKRLSCALCVLGDRNDLTNGLRYAPALAKRYIEMERDTGFSFRMDLRLETLAADTGLLETIMATPALAAATPPLNHV